MILTGLVLIQIGLTLLQTAILIGVIESILSRQSKRDSVLAEEVGQLRYQVNDLSILIRQRWQAATLETGAQPSDKSAEQSVADREAERFRDHPEPPVDTHINLSGK